MYSCTLCGHDLGGQGDVIELITAKRHSLIEYIHIDTWITCPECGNVMLFGIEKGASEAGQSSPPYWFGEATDQQKKLILKWLRIDVCEWCRFCDKARMVFHKAWVNNSKAHTETALDPGEYQARAYSNIWEGRHNVTYIPAQILYQLKCPRCNIVKYGTI